MWAIMPSDNSSPATRQSISRDILARFGLTLDASWESTLISAAKMDAVNADRSGVDQVPAYEPGLQGARASLPLVVVRTSVDRPNLAFHVRSKDGLEVDEVCAMIAEDIGARTMHGARLRQGITLCESKR